MHTHAETDNYRKHTTKNPVQRFLINNFFKVLLSEVEQMHPESVLDAGCGEGFTLAKLEEGNIGSLHEGIEYDQTALDIGKTMYPKILLKKGNIYQLPYSDNMFDVVLCTEVLEHLESPESAIKELQRVTKKHCVVSVPHEPYFQLANFLRGKNISRWGNDIEHIQHWSAQGIAELLAKYFTVKKVKTPFPWTIVIAEK